MSLISSRFVGLGLYLQYLKILMESIIIVKIRSIVIGANRHKAHTNKINELSCT